MKKYILLFLSCLIYLSVKAQTDFQWNKDLDLPYSDSEGNRLTGTEVIHLVNHKGELYAGNSYWNESVELRRGQVWVKESATGNWKRDFQMPSQNSRVPSLYSFIFQKDKNARPITPDTILVAGSTFDKGENVNGPAVVFMRDDASQTWIRHNLGFTDHPFSYTQVRSMGFHQDKVTGIDMVFAGANPAPTGVYAGAYDESVPGKISWNDTTELEPIGYQRVMGFAVCNDTLYLATQREIYKRIDGHNPKWVEVLNLADASIINTYGMGIDEYWLNDEDIRGFRSIPNPTGNGQVLIFGALNHIFRLHPQNNYQLIAEQDIEDVLETATTHDFHYLQTQTIVDYQIPNSTEIIQLIGFEAFYDTTYLNTNPQPHISGFNQQGYYFERRQTPSGITYQLKEIIDFNINPQPDSLARVRTFAVSPFPEDSAKVIYSGGFAPWFEKQVSNTAWIYKGTFSSAPVSGYTKFTDIDYTVGSPQNELNLDIYVPNGGAASKPVVVYVHGGSWRKGDKSQTQNKDEFFTKLDYVFVSVNYRLGEDPVNVNKPDRILYDDQTGDVAKAIAWLMDNIQNYKGNPARITLLGHSAGAHLVSLISTDEKYLQAEGMSLDQIRCTCSLDAGAHDIPYYLDNYEREGSGQWDTYVNIFTDDRQNWEDASPINHLSPIKNIPDFMLVHQGNTQRIDLHQNFGNALTSNQVKVTYLNAEPLDHEGINSVLGSSQNDIRIQSYNDSVSNFYENCLNKVVLAIDKPVYLKEAIQIFPNPVDSEMVIRLEESLILKETSIRVFDLRGKMLRNFTPTRHEMRFDLTKYPRGTYLIKIFYKEDFLTQKIVKL